MNHHDEQLEKRKERRFPINSEVFMQLGHNKVITGMCINISGSGMLIKTDQLLSIGKTLHLDIREGRINFSTDAKVMHCKQQDQYFFIGLQTNKSFD